MSRLQLLDLHIDLQRQRVERAGAALDVSGLSFRLFACLLAHGDRVMSYDRLAQEVWAPAVVSEETITQRIKLLRQALGDDSRAPRYIRSVRGQGYQLCAVPQAVAEAEPEAAATAPRSRRWRWAGAAALVAAAVVAALWWRYAATPSKSPLLARADYYAGIGQADNNERAIALYQQALAANPDDAAALIGLSRLSSARTCLYNGGRDNAERGLALARQLLRRDAENAKAWSAQAYAHDCLGDIDAAVSGYERALRLDPDDDNTRASLAYLQMEQGQVADALRGNMQLRGDPARVRFRDVQVARGLELLGFAEAARRRHQANFRLFPDNVFSNIAWPRSLFGARRYDEATAAVREALTRGTPHPDLYLLQGELALQRGDRAGARAAFAQALRLRPQSSLGITVNALYADTAPTPTWIAQRLAELRPSPAQPAPWPGLHLELAMLELARQRPDAAVAALDAAVAAGYRDRAYLQASPLFAALHGDPAFARVLARIDTDMARQRAQVASAAWKPADLP
ncbi:winged helix-turn-helix domain-containing protein [Lysobacter sp. 5GHs7-4]|uniref:winged helix-turn-helix transcriptional regulator n=1 Tax=Lysobacter sp. 5GHs7-4 TaxID=2904253 RepID=UPI001E5A003F|nr:winged helix-turn-helix transcriptional regulator [Lysobacter sp. 5GHs7-4]UHQ22839.1 winged helix-turn-helix domain-containing protein [Lysobacter sp. 5GHs7-4]